MNKKNINYYYAKIKNLLCKLLNHKIAYVDRPGTSETYKFCKRCRKRTVWYCGLSGGNFSLLDQID